MPDTTRIPVIVSAARTPIGKFLGGLAPLSAPELGAVAIGPRSSAPASPAGEVQEVIMGNVIQGGVGQAPARQALLKSGIPATVSAVTINKVCGSGLKAVMLAAQSIKAGDAEVIVAGGHGVDVERAVLRVRHAQRREARRPDDGRRDDQGRPLVRVLRRPHGRPRRVHGEEGGRHAAGAG